MQEKAKRVGYMYKKEADCIKGMVRPGERSYVGNGVGEAYLAGVSQRQGFFPCCAAEVERFHLPMGGCGKYGISSFPVCGQQQSSWPERGEAMGKERVGQRTIHILRRSEAFVPKRLHSL